MSSDFLNSCVDFCRHPRFVRNTIEYSSVIPNYFRSYALERSCREHFDKVHTYVMFIGIGRSGTSLIGALLDAHPRIIISSHETTLKYLYPPLFTREQIYYLLLRNSRNSARVGRVGGGGYSYAVAGQWQGKFDSLEIIGDKSKSAQDVTWLTSRPSLLDKLARVTGARIRMMHVMRNPYDTIATRSLRRNLSVRKISREYFSHCDRLRELISRIESISTYDVERIPVYLEDFIENCESRLASICNRLGVEAGGDYLRDCAGIVRQQAHKSRFEVDWDKGLIGEIKQKIEDISFLRRYSFED